MVPQELTQLRQWVVANKIKKIPCGVGLVPASVTNRQTWLSYQEACDIVADKNNNYNCVGFVLSKEDPYCIIDLDDAIPTASEVQKQILDALSFTYIEKSVSGTGYHIIVKATTHEGRRKENVEVYSYSRYMIMTGNAINENPIIPSQEIVDDIIQSMEAKNYTYLDLDLEDSVPDVSDETVLDECEKHYGTKFECLYKGEFRLHFKSQSEADLMLLAILCQHSSSNAQVVRLFRKSKLGLRKKASRIDYLTRTINKVRKNLDWNATKITSTAEELYSFIVSELEKESPHTKEIDPLPDGILKDLTLYILNSSIRPVRDIALVTALGFFAGLIGRSYNISGSGLNLYMLLLAPTGSGKEQVAAGIDRILGEMRPLCPQIDCFVGPRGFASGQALLRYLNQQVSMCCVFGEVGYLFQSMTGRSMETNGHIMMFRRVLLDVYQKSGYNSVLHPTAYADFKNNVQAVRAPNFTIIGEGTPTSFYDTVSEDIVQDGLLPRFTIIEYTGGRPARNKQADIVAMSDELKQSLAGLCSVALQNLGTCDVRDVEASEEAQALLDEFDIYCDDKINESQEYIKQIWNRAHLKALKFSALLAISSNYENPIIELEHARWAISFVEKEISDLLFKFDGGELSDDNKYTYILKSIITEYVSKTPAQRLKENVPFVLTHNATIIPEFFIMKKLRANKTFKKDMLNVATINIILEEAIEQELLQRIDSAQARTRFNYNGRLYAIGRNFI